MVNNKYNLDNNTSDPVQVECIILESVIQVLEYMVGSAK